MPEKLNRSISLSKIKLNDGFWTPIQNLVADVVIPYQEQILKDEIPGAEKSHAIENFYIAAGESEEEFYGLIFQDSDLAKWLEAAAYSLLIKPNPELEKRLDGIISVIGRAQREDGYLNTYFTLKEPERKWQNLQECHELYCNGHMLEAAVAYKQATGKDNFLGVMRKNADLICSRFGEHGLRGYPGHQEIEIALLRLHRLTGEKKYLDTAAYFLNERGREPEYFQQELKDRGWVCGANFPKERSYNQAHAPVRRQDKAVGHAVRALYMYSAMADLAAETKDAELAEACRVLWRNIAGCQMYITGGVGATVHGEAFSVDYELPNDLVYAETCASVAMVFFARQMLEMEANGEYADILEKELFNGVLSGMQLDGKRFFYVNPLEVVRGVSGILPEYKHVKPERPGWYTCACCPPNVSRLLMSLGQYAWGSGENGIYAHTYAGGDAFFDIAGGVNIGCVSEYPWEGRVRYTVTPEKDGASFFLAVHIPGWCKAWTLKVNGETYNVRAKNGYVYLEREWNRKDEITLELEMPVMRMYASTLVRADAGCVALQRGPVVYCFEETDNGGNLSALRLPRAAAVRAEKQNEGILSGRTVLKTEGLRVTSGKELYSDTPPDETPVQLTAVPYYAWGNREPGGMRVWLTETNSN